LSYCRSREKKKKKKKKGEVNGEREEARQTDVVVGEVVERRIVCSCFGKMVTRASLTSASTSQVPATVGYEYCTVPVPEKLAGRCRYLGIPKLSALVQKQSV